MSSSLPLPPSLQHNSTSTLSFALNSTRISIHNPDPALTLLEFIRSQGFTGTKLGCNEGGCGACTVVMGTLPRRGTFPHQGDEHDDDQDGHDPLRPVYRSINACLMPLIGVHGTHILTIEGLGTSSAPHPIQLRFGRSGGFQCSACASGIIMAFYALLREKGTRGVTEREVEEGFDGNLCRCTGYRVLLDCAKSFATDWKGSGNLVVDSDADGEVQDENKVENDHTHRADEDSMATQTDPVPIKEATAISGGSGVSTGILPEDRQPGSGPTLCAKGNACCRSSSSSSGKKGCDPSTPQNATQNTPAPRRIPGIPVFHYKPYSPTAEPLFPPWLKKSLLNPESVFAKNLILTAPPPLKDQDPRESSSDSEAHQAHEAHEEQAGEIWVRPSTLHSLLTLMKRYPLAKIRSGNTETGIEVRFKGSRWSVSVWVGAYLTGLAGFEREREGLRVGAVLPLTDLVTGCRGVRRALGASSDRDRDVDAHKRRAGKWEDRGKEMILEAIEGNLKHFASTQIRNVATVAGNITTASPISDLNPIWVAVGAELSFLQPENIGEDGLDGIARPGGQREDAVGKIGMRDFFTGYRKTALPRGGVMMDLFIPFPKPGEKVLTKAYKQSKRKDDDIAIVTCCLRVEIEGERTIKDVRLVYGGMAPTTTESPKTQEYLRGKEWGGQDTLWNALEILSAEDYNLPHTVPGGMPAYRKSLAMGFFAKFWAEVSLELGLDLESDQHRVRDLEGLAASEIHRGLQEGKQDLEDVDLAVPSGQGIPHLAHLKHVTGEAQYCDDIPRQHNELVGALVFSQKPHAKILSIDSEYALSMTGVHDFVTVKDLPGSNIWNPPAMDEVLFAEDEVFTCGQVIGVVLAETKNQAQAAARAVKVEYEELPFILTIAEAIAADSFFKPRPKLERGDIGLIEKADHVLEGWWHMGGQEQFYIETNATLVIPHPEDEMEVWSSTQNPSETQVFVASALGIPQNRVTCRVRRLGGGFGGKETRSICLAAQMAVAAKKNRRPVRCMLDRDEDMISSGQRHPFAAKYKVGFNNDGKLVGMDVEIYNNGGWSQDLSQAVLERAMTHSDNCYMIPNFRIRGKICKTNTMSNSAFRGFGGPQVGLRSVSVVRDMC
jgi:xanthine dehydrogenase/oxidase